jgi:hypothetical protein
VDSFQQGNQNNQPKRQGTGRLGGTGNLNAPGGAGMDAFKPSGTGQLGMPNGTKRLASGMLDCDRLLADLRTEFENGKVIVGKLEGRVAVLRRALMICDRPIEANQICQGISPGEANFTKQVAQALQADPNTRRRAQVAATQFDSAQKGLAQAAEVLELADRYEGPARNQYVEQNCQVEKLRGQLYPLINLHVVFKDNPLLSQLIPPPKVSNEPPLPPPPPQPAQPQAAAKPATGALADPAVKDIADKINKMTGNLKDMFFKKKQ